MVYVLYSCIEGCIGKSTKFRVKTHVVNSTPFFFPALISRVVLTYFEGS